MGIKSENEELFNQIDIKCNSWHLFLCWKDGKMYVVGGKENENDTLSSVEYMNLETHKWQSIDDLPEATHSHCQVILVCLGRKIFTLTVTAY